MASLTIRNLDDGLKQQLRMEAAKNGRSMEEEARNLLKSAMRRRAYRPPNIGIAIYEAFQAIGGVELELPPRVAGRDPPDFSGPDFDRS